MKTCIDQVIHAALRKKEDPINVLYMGYNGWFESMFSLTSVMCYIGEDALEYMWPGRLPETFTILPKGMGFIPNRVDIDVIICNSRREQVYKAAGISDVYHIPLILVEHELPASYSKENLRKYVNSRLPEQCLHVVPHSIVKDEWCLDENTIEIPYGFGIRKAELKSNNVLVAGDYSVDDYGLLDTMLSCDPDAIGVGHNPGITTPYNDANEMYEAMSKSYICVTALSPNQSPILPMMAMSSNCVVVTNRTRWSEQIIEDGVNGFLFESASEIKKIVRKLVKDKDKISEVCYNAKMHILENYSRDKFEENWKSFIHNTVTKVYKR